jgi:hypothetical protein
MATTYTSSLQLQLMANGEDSGTWGTNTNTNWNLIEQAVAGAQTITMANANYTLSVNNGASDESRNMVLIVQGTNSGVYQVVAPLVTKVYIISNKTSGGYAITIGGTTGTTVSIPNGTTTQVYCDGTNFYSALSGTVTAATGNFSSGLIGVTNGSTAGEGYVGQVLTASNQTSPISCTAGSDVVMCSVNLTAGDWDVQSLGSGYASTGNSYDDFVTGTNSTTSLVYGVGFYGVPPYAGTETAITLSYFANYNVTTTTTVYCMVRMNGGTETGFTGTGYIFARRMR